jgi:5-methylcytosine-specific restriction endonuclease McrA
MYVVQGTLGRGWQKENHVPRSHTSMVGQCRAWRSLRLETRQIPLIGRLARPSDSAGKARPRQDRQQNNRLAAYCNEKKESIDDPSDVGSFLLEQTRVANRASDRRQCFVCAFGCVRARTKRPTVRVVNWQYRSSQGQRLLDIFSERLSRL